MPSIWEATVTLIDADGLTSSLRLKFGSITAGADFGDEAIEARTRLSDFVTALKAVTDANVYRTRLYALDQGGVDAGLPATVAGVDNEAVVMVHTNDTNYPAELATIRIPNPADGVWLSGDKTLGLDPADADVQALVALYSADIEISDGEHVNTAEGTAGINSGFWRSVAKKAS